LQAASRTRGLPRWLVAAIGVGTVGLMAWWWLGEPAPQPPPAQAQAESRLAEVSAQTLRPVSPFGAGKVEAPALVPAPAEAPLPTPVADRPPPSGMSSEQWRDLQAALKDHPDRDAELRRVAQYLAFKSNFELFQAARSQHAGTPELQTLARQLDAELDARLANAELNAAEAVAIKSTLLDELEPDGARRATRLDQWARQHAPAAGGGMDGQREARYQKEAAAILAAWQALPPTQRDPHQLEAQLDALRQRIFSP
jgi:hypothetical protein